MFPTAKRDLLDMMKRKKALKPEILKKYIFGGHVADYMSKLQENDEKRYKRHFSRYIAAGIAPKQISEIYTKAHAAIRADPSFVKSVAKGKPAEGAKPKRYNKRPLSYAQRKDRIRQKKATAEKKKAQ